MSTLPPLLPPGPRPLPLHLVLAQMQWLNWPAAWQQLKSGSTGWNAAQKNRAAKILGAGENLPADALRAALTQEGLRRYAAYLRGVNAYRKAPRPPALPPVPVLWTQGSSTLRDYGGGGRPVLVVPSLINKATILDLEEGGSLLRFLAARGARPLLLDWGAPGETEQDFGVGAYILRLGQALDAARQMTGERPDLIGYCMGGTMALAAAQLFAPSIRKLALLAAPWDFHAQGPELGALVAMLWKLHGAAQKSTAPFPVDALQAMFALFQPAQVLEKFVSFPRLSSESKGHFVSVEDWLNDGIPLARAAARDLMQDWYGRNTPHRGMWRVEGEAIRPRRVEAPTLLIVPRRDRIVPPPSALALGVLLPQSRILAPELGHIGMIVGKRAPPMVWEPLAAWLTGL